MFARVTRTLEQLFATSRRRPRRQVRPAPRPRLGVEPLEDRLALSHFGAAAVVAHEQLTGHSNPAGEAARLALLSQLAQQSLLKEAHHAAPPAHPAPAPTPPPSHPAPPAPTPAPPLGV